MTFHLFPLTTAALWLGVGLLGQALFSGRFLVQWVASEMAGRSIVPNLFWHLSIAGGVVLFAYACYRRDPVFMIGQGMGLLVYARNLWLLGPGRRKADGTAETAPVSRG